MNAGRTANVAASEARAARPATPSPSGPFRANEPTSFGGELNLAARPYGAMRIARVGARYGEIFLLEAATTRSQTVGIESRRDDLGQVVAGATLHLGALVRARVAVGGVFLGSAGGRGVPIGDAYLRAGERASLGAAWVGLSREPLAPLLPLVTDDRERTRDLGWIGGRIGSVERVMARVTGRFGRDGAADPWWEGYRASGSIRLVAGAAGALAWEGMTSYGRHPAPHRHYATPKTLAVGVAGLGWRLVREQTVLTGGFGLGRGLGEDYEGGHWAVPWRTGRLAIVLPMAQSWRLGAGIEAAAAGNDPRLGAQAPSTAAFVSLGRWGEGDSESDDSEGRLGR